MQIHGDKHQVLYEVPASSLKTETRPETQVFTFAHIFHFNSVCYLCIW